PVHGVHPHLPPADEIAQRNRADHRQPPATEQNESAADVYRHQSPPYQRHERIAQVRSIEVSRAVREVLVRTVADHEGKSEIALDRYHLDTPPDEPFEHGIHLAVRDLRRGIAFHTAQDDEIGSIIVDVVAISENIIFPVLVDPVAD